jgi:predicted dehydrogenase
MSASLSINSYHSNVLPVYQLQGQEHVSYILKYNDSLSIEFLCDPNQSSIDTALSIIEDSPADCPTPRTLTDEKELLQHVQEIDLLVIASPNYWHTPQLLRWCQYDITILVEKPVAISEKQVSALKAALPNCKAKIWVAMEYRFIPAINKLIQVRV